MTDIVDKETRSRMMGNIRSHNTRPEVLVRKFLFSNGYRFRLNRKDLPGSPDIVLPKHKLAIFVHGCFWHRHKGCRIAYTPRSRKTFWQTKFSENVRRDKRSTQQLRKLGWRVTVVWECRVRKNQLNPLLSLLKKGTQTRTTASGA